MAAECCLDVESFSPVIGIHHNIRRSGQFTVITYTCSEGSFWICRSRKAVPSLHKPGLPTHEEDDFETAGDVREITHALCNRRVLSIQQPVGSKSRFILVIPEDKRWFESD